MKERKALLDALQKSIQESEEESEAEIALLLSDAKESAEELWTTYTNDMEETCALYLSKTMQLAEKHNLSEDQKHTIEADIGAMFQHPDDEVITQEVKVKSQMNKRGRPKGSKNIPKKKGSGKGKALAKTVVEEDDELTETEEEEQEEESLPIKKRHKSPRTSLSKKAVPSRPRGRPPAGMQWSESQEKWVPIKLALRRIMDTPSSSSEAPKGMQWDATKEEWVPMKLALKRLM